MTAGGSGGSCTGYGSMALLELINLRKARKAILYLVCIIIALWLQTMVLSRVVLLGAKPFFLPVLVVALGLFEGGVWGGMLGLAAGIGPRSAFSPGFWRTFSSTGASSPICCWPRSP